MCLLVIWIRFVRVFSICIRLRIFVLNMCDEKENCFGKIHKTGVYGHKRETNKEGEKNIAVEREEQKKLLFFIQLIRCCCCCCLDLFQ